MAISINKGQYYDVPFNSFMSKRKSVLFHLQYHWLFTRRKPLKRTFDRAKDDWEGRRRLYKSYHSTSSHENKALRPYYHQLTSFRSLGPTRVSDGTFLIPETLSRTTPLTMFRKKLTKFSNPSDQKYKTTVCAFPRTTYSHHPRRPAELYSLTSLRSSNF